MITAYEDVPKLLASEDALPLERRSAGGRPVAAGRARAPRAAAAGGPRHARRLRAAAQARARRRGRASAGTPARGRCGASASTRWPAIRRWACACRWRRCRRCCRSTTTAIRRSTPFAPRGALPARDRLDAAAQGDARGAAPREVIQTALCVEARDGHLHVFMPPVERLEAYVALLAAIEDAPPRRARRSRSRATRRRATRGCAVLSVTPDPGVIEVNIHPSSSWHELVANNEALYEEARQSRLGTEKFMLDGRHTGTGGGNHVTLGGATPADSPLLRRPDLLRSLITYWQNHPALSYLFSRHVHRPDQPGAARRRGARRQALRARDRVPADGAAARVRHRDAAAVAGRPAAAPPADRPHRQHAPRRVLDRQAVFARRPDRAGSACSSSAPSRCRRTRG